MVKVKLFLVNFLGLVMLTSLSSACTQTSGVVEAAPPDAVVTAGPGAAVVTDAAGEPVTIEDTSRLVTLGGPVTEIVFALGAGDKVVGVDTSSVFPEEATHLPQVGYQRQLAAEGVLALNPTLILATTEAGPPEAVAQLKDSGVTVLILPAEEAIQPNFNNFQFSLIGLTILKSVLLVGVGFLVSKYILKNIFGSISKSPEMVVSVPIGWAALVAGAADLIRLSKEMDALIAGVP